MSVPSLSTLEGVKKYINAMGNSPSAVAPKQTVMLDWASKEDGTHVLTITVGNKVSYFKNGKEFHILLNSCNFTRKIPADCGST